MEKTAGVILGSKHDGALKRIRITSRPPLSRKLICIMIDFLIQEDRRPVPDDTPVWTRSWLELLAEDTELGQYTKGLSIKQRFLNWLKVLDVFVTEDGVHQLCIAGSNRIVPSKEEFRKIIRDAHRSTGEFESSSAEKQCGAMQSKGNPKKHNSIEKCIKMIKAKYAFGNKEFGLRKIYVYKEVLRCPECHHDGKMKTVRRSIIDEPELIDPDFGNEMNFIVLEDAPMCMALKGPSQSSVWYNQSDLANEDSVYKKLLGVIEEIGIEVGKTIQKDTDSEERLVTKICCAEKLIHDLKKGAEKDFAFRIPSSHFFQDYDRLAKEFVAIGDTALYLQDMNYLASIYRRFRNDELVERMNSTLKELEKCEASHLNFVLRGNEIYLQGSSDSLEHGKQELETGIDSCQ